MKDFVAIDFETANSEPTSVCSVGIVVVRDGEIGMDYPDYEFYDTLYASRRHFGRSLPNHQLHTVSAACGYDLTNHHHALADAEACAVIAMQIL